MDTFISDLSKKEFSSGEKISAETLRPSILRRIQDDHPHFDQQSCLSLSELNVYRQKYIADYLASEIGELSQLEDTVLNALRNKDTLTDKIEEQEDSLTLGQRLADRVASFGGSWNFIICFAVFMLFWIGGDSA